MKPVNFEPIDATFNPKAPEGWFDPFYQSPPPGVVVEGDYGSRIIRVQRKLGEWLHENGKPLFAGRPSRWRYLKEGDANA